MAVVQADVVAHSMGGDIARVMPTVTGFANQTNYGLGPVHKLITIGTPHQGSPLAGDHQRCRGEYDDCRVDRPRKHSCVRSNHCDGDATAAGGSGSGDHRCFDAHRYAGSNAGHGEWLEFWLGGRQRVRGIGKYERNIDC